MSPLVLIDASVYIFRAYFSLPDTIRNPKDEPTGATYGFASALLKLLRELKPRYVGVAFDQSLTTSFRNEIYPEYKASRALPPLELERQLQWCERLAQYSGLATMSSPRYEADDLMATAAAHAHRAGQPVMVVSSDKDLTQILCPGDELWDIRTGARWTYEEKRAALGFPPERMADFLALVGDPVDNIPGVPKVGAKTASALLSRYGSLDALYERLDDVARSELRGAAGLARRLVEYRDQAYLSRQLARTVSDVPLPADAFPFARRAPDLPGLQHLFRELGFGTSLLERYTAL